MLEQKSTLRGFVALCGSGSEAMLKMPTAVALMFLAVTAVADDGLFVRTRSDGSRTTLGKTAEPDATTRCVHLTVAQVPLERWPLPVTINVTDADSAAVWNVTLESRLATRPHDLCAPAGSYKLAVSAPHYRSERREVRLVDANVDLGSVALQRYPEITGTVRVADGASLAGAFVSDRRRLSAKTDVLGAFRLEVNDDWPAQIEISFPGLTTRHVAVPKARASTSLPPVVLSKGSRLDLQVENAPAEFDVDLTRETQYKRSEVVNTAHAYHVAPRVAFEDLAKGEYTLVIRGAGSLQKLASTLSVPEAESISKTVRIEPLAVSIEVRRGGSPLPNALVAVQSDSNRWASEVRADAEGDIHGEVWQRGPYLFAVRRDESSPPVLLLETIDGTNEAAVVLDVPDRSISGRVIDVDDESPVSKAEVHVESVNDDHTGGTQSAFSGSDGKFALESMRDGSHTLVVEANGYVRSDPVIVRIDQSSPQRDLTFRVTRGLSRRLRVLTSQRIPVAGAIVIEMVNDVATEVTKTDTTGAVTLHTSPGSAPAVYVLPAEGSLAIARLPSKPPDGEETIVVRDGNAALELHAEDANGKPIPHLRFVMRFDGELIPPDVADVLEMRRGVVLSTGMDGVARLDRLPVGFLEMWPVRTHDDLQQVLASGAMNAPVRVGLREGVNVVTTTFARKP